MSAGKMGALGRSRSNLFWLPAALLLFCHLTCRAAVAPGVIHGWGNYDSSNRPLGLADAVDVKAAAGYTFALRSNGTVALWGSIESSQLAPPPGLTNVVQIAAGHYMAMALTSDGRVQVWGAGGHEDQSAITNPPSSATNITAIAAGLDHCLALRQDGTVVAWGSLGFSTNLSAAKVPSGLSNVVQIAAGQSYSLVVTAEGNLVGWGHPASYSPIPANATNISAFALGPAGNVVALRTDGSVIAWGFNIYGQATVPPGLTNVVAIASGEYHCVALRADGTLVTWGLNGEGQASIPTNLFQFRAIAAGTFSTVALNSAPLVDSSSGGQSPLAGDTITLQATVASAAPWSAMWLKDGQITPWTNPTLTLTNVQVADSGTYLLVASNSSGSTFGENISLSVQPSSVRGTKPPTHQAVPLGQTATFTAPVGGTEPIRFQWFHDGVLIPAATNATLVIAPVTAADEGAYTVTASNIYGGVVSDPAYLAATVPRILQPPTDLLARTNWDISLTTQVLSATPVTYHWFKDGVELTSVTGPVVRFTSVTADDAGEYVLVVANAAGSVTNPPVHVAILQHSLPNTPAVLVDWGNTPYTTPAVLHDATNIVAVAAGTWHDVGLRQDGSVSVWCDPQNLGLRAVPPEATNVADVFAGSHYNLVLRKDGSVVMWGSGPFGSLPVAPPVADVVSAGCGDHQILLLKRDGTVLTFPAYGFTPPNVTNVLAVAVTDEFCFALRADGKVLNWRYANDTPDGPAAIEIPQLTNVVALAGGESWVSVALRKDGTVVSLLQSAQWAPVAGISNAIAVAGGRGFAALLATGEVQTWGVNDILVVPEGLRADRIAGGLLHVAALTTAPFFAAQPQNQTNYSGGYASFSAVIRSASPYSLQWYYETQLLPGATNLSLSLTNLRPSQSGSYRLLASNQATQTWSRPTPLTVLGPGEFLTLATNQILLAGDMLQLNAGYAAYPTATAQWQFNHLPILGETNAVLVLGPMTEAMSGSYRLALSNSFGVVTSSNIHVTVLPSVPRILTQPAAPASLPDGAALQLLVSAVGTQPLRYQWYFNDAPLAGETQPALQFPALAAEDNGVYRVAVSNSVGGRLSDPVLVSTYRAAPAPEITTGNLLVRQGRTLRLDSVVGGTAGSTLQWQRNGTDLAGETNTVLLLVNSALTHAGDYAVRATNAWGAVLSAPVKVWVLPNRGPGMVKCWGFAPAPVPDVFAEMVAPGFQHAVALLPDGTVQAWGNNSYSQATVPPGLSNVVQVAAGDYFSLALKSDGTVVGWGQNNSGQATPPPGLDDVRAIAAGVSHALALKADGAIVAWGAASYTAVPVGLLPSVAIAAGPTYSLALSTNGQVKGWGSSGSPTNVPAAVTNIAALAAAASGACGLNTAGQLVPWGSFPTAPTNATNVISLAAGASHAAALSPDGRIIAWGSDTYGQTRGPNGVSNIFALSAWQRTTAALSGLPKVVASPANRTVGLGQALTLTVAALGTPPLAYQWYFAGQPVDGWTNASLGFASFQATNAGAYSIEVKSPYGGVTSNFTLSVGTAPTITQQPGDQYVIVGSNATFRVVATGSGLLRYQWRLNQLPLLGATNSTLILTNVLFEDTGQVSVGVSNAYGNASSRLAVLQPVPPARMRVTGEGKQLRIQLTALLPDGTYRLMSSTNLIDWVPLQSVASPSSTLELTLPMTNGPVMFYRLRFLNP